MEGLHRLSKGVHNQNRESALRKQSVAVMIKICFALTGF